MFNRDKGCKICGESIWGGNMNAHHITDRNEKYNNVVNKSVLPKKIYLFIDDFIIIIDDIK